MSGAEASWLDDAEALALFDQARDLLGRWDSEADIEDLDASLRRFDRVLQEADPHLSLRFLAARDMSVGLLKRYNELGDREDLETAVSHTTKVIDHVETRDVRAHALSLRATCRLKQFELTGREERLDGAISDLHRGLDLAEADATRWQVLCNLAGALSDRAEIRHRPEDRDRAVFFAREALEVAGDKPEKRPESLNTLASCLYERYLADRTRSDDLAAAIEVWSEATRDSSLARAQRAKSLRNLCLGLTERYRTQGDLEDLDQAIRVQREALRICPSESPHRTYHLSSLSIALNYRFAREGSLLDLEESMGLVHEALDALPPGAPRRSALLNNLALGYRAHFERLNDVDSLRTAIRLATESVAATASAHSDRPQRVNNLATALLRRAQKVRVGDSDGALADIESALGLWREASTLEQLDQSSQALVYHGLSLGHSARFDLTGDPKDLDRAIQAVDTALGNISERSPTRPLYLVQWAYVLRLRDGRNGDDRSRAVDIYRQMASGGVMSAREAGLAAQRWGHWAFEKKEWAEAVEAFEFASRAISALVSAQPLRVGQEAWLQETKGLPARAAFAAVQSGRPELAVEMVERLRSKMLAGKLDLLGLDLDALRQTEPSLAAQIEDALRALASAERREIPLSEIRGAHRALRDAYVELRKVPGLERFGEPLTFEQIRDAIEEECLVLLATTSAGSLALLLTSEGVEVIHAPLSQDELSVLLARTQRDGQSAANRSLVGTANAASVDGYRTGLFESAAMRNSLDDFLRTLGSRLLAPIGDALRRRSIDQIVLIPLGDLCLIPWAAVPCDSENATRLLEVSTLSVSPSLRAWIQSRDRLNRAVEPRLFAVGSEGSRPGSLPAMPFEVSRVSSVSPRVPSRSLVGSEAHRDAVLEVLSESTHLHLACHGTFDVEDPLSSYVELTRSKLTLRDLMLTEIRSAGLQVVSLAACQSAIHDFRRFPDEMLGLPMGWLQVGAAGVVAALWKVDDLATALLMERFWRHHLEDGRSAGQALRLAQLWLRDVTIGEITAEFRRVRQSGTAPATALRMLPDLLARLWPGDDEEKPFASPYFWGAFVYVGA